MFRRFMLVMVTSLLLVSAASANDAIKQRLESAHGADRLDKVEVIRFTFNVQKGERKVTRQWVWNPRTTEVVRTVNDSSVNYLRSKLSDDSPAEHIAADKQLINDSFWLLPAMHVGWSGDDVRVESHGRAELPIGEGDGEHVVVTYPKDQGGYTPGDVYELFLDDRGLITAWIFRRGGSEKPTLVTSFEDYEKHGPLMIATEHTNEAGTFRLWFSDVAVDLRQ